MRFNGSDMFAIGPIGPLPKFSVEAIVRPEWDLINQRGFFYCVFESSVHIPGQGAPPPLKNAGFAVFAGPHDLATPRPLRTLGSCGWGPARSSIGQHRWSPVPWPR